MSIIPKENLTRPWVPRPQRPVIVYALLRNGSLLDLYANPNNAFEAARQLMTKTTGGEWYQTRPGRWYSGQMRLDVKEWEIR